MDDRENASYASPPCFLHELDPVSLGYMSRTETVELLNRLLEAERAGARGVALMSREATGEPARRTLREIAGDEADFCAMLARHVAGLGGAPSRATGAFFAKLVALDSADARLALLDRGQAWVARKLRDALPRVLDDGLYGDLRRMLEIHERNIERAARLRAGATGERTEP